MQIVPATMEHMEEIAQIEKEVMTMAWSKESFIEALKADHTLFLVALDAGNRVMGYIVYYISFDEAELVDVVTSPLHRRCHVAANLMDFSLRELVNRGVSSIFLEVRDSNEGAIALYEKYDFFEIGRRKNFYVDPVEDARLMKKDN